MSKFIRYLILIAFIAAAFLFVRQAAAATPKRLAASPTPTGQSCVPVKQAIAKKQIQLVLAANGELFYHKPIHYQITNSTQTILVICFPTGQELNSDDSGLQTLMVIDPTPIDVPAGQLVEGDLFAFCINETKHAPSKDDGYQLGSMATGKLLSLAETIQSDSASGHLGAQLAIWAITDQYSMDDLNAIPSPDQPSLTDSIKPVLCLGQDEITLGVKLLQDSNTGVVLFHGEDPLTAYCQQQGIPNLSQVGQKLKVVGIWASVFAVVSALLCVGLVVGVILLAIRLFRKRK